PNRALSYSVSQANTTNSPVVASVDPNTGRLTLTYLSNHVGTDTITVTVTDSGPDAKAGPAADKSESITSTFSVVVRGPVLSTSNLAVESADVYFWNQPMTLDYVISNTGPVASGPFFVQVYLSPDGTRSIDPKTDTLVQTFFVAGVNATGSTPTSPPH